MAFLHRFNRAQAKADEDVLPVVEPEGIDAFASEASLEEPSAVPEVGRSRGLWGVPAAARLTTEESQPTEVAARPVSTWVAAGVALAIVVGGGVWWWAARQAATPPALATLTLQTTPPGLQVSIAGKPAGTTPMTTSLAAGQYQVELTAPDGRRRTFAVTLTSGGSVVERLELPAVVAPAAPAAALHVQTEPARLMVSVDGAEQGLSPITIPSLAAGEHVVTVRTANGTLRRTVTVEDGKTVSLVLAGEASSLRAGWVTFSTGIPLELRENGKVIGTSDAERLMLPVGEHEIEMRNDQLGFRAVRTVAVPADRAVAVSVELPRGTLSINALPWAEVWIDGERIGETPIANISRPIGSHEVLLRHPQFGDRKATVTVSMKQTARLGIDMRTP